MRGNLTDPYGNEMDWEEMEALASERRQWEAAMDLAERILYAPMDHEYADQWVGPHCLAVESEGHVPDPPLGW